jgi:hypothetical protein
MERIKINIHKGIVHQVGFIYKKVFFFRTGKPVKYNPRFTPNSNVNFITSGTAHYARVLCVIRIHMGRYLFEEKKKFSTKRQEK